MAVRCDARKRPVTPAKTFMPVPFSRMPMFVNSTSRQGRAGSRFPYGSLILGLVSSCCAMSVCESLLWPSRELGSPEGGGGPPKAAHTGTWAEPCLMGLPLFGF